MDDSQVRLLESQLKAFQRRRRLAWTPVAGLSRSSVRTLGAIARRPGGCQPGQIVDELQMTSSNVAAALRELDSGGFIDRRRDEIDTRRVNIHLTDAGQHLVAESRAERDSWLRAAILSLLNDEEQATLLAAGGLLERLAGFETDPVDESVR